ncbi:MAG: 3',5'-cyclic adenosine monophosphate phosphodiesterase CpdA [Planctomycetes bacterium]|nr:3',5'-cyclic adenosine monophosphate phosphodiesterase CpdA [Planctomycetota bacterium]
MFQFGGMITALLNLLIWLALRRRLKLAFPKRGRLLGILAGVLMLVLLHPSLAMALGGWSGLRAVRDGLPEWAQVLSMAAQFAAWTYGVVLLATRAPAWVAALVRRVRRQDPAPVNQERRRLLARASLAVPAAALVFSGAGVASYMGAPVITRLRLPVRREFTGLHGVTLAQVSDVHIGSYMDRERVHGVVDAMNAANADIHVVTGDLTDNHMDQVELARWFLSRLRPRRGEIYMCMGNHEYYTARPNNMKRMLDEFAQGGGVMLVDEARALEFGGDMLWLGATDYPQRGGSISGRSTRDSLLHTTGQMADDGAPRIVLSHHPRTFYEGREMPLDLMLSGHTHGGQINLGRIGDAALTPILPIDFYHNGYYEHAESTQLWSRPRRLYVNAGAGGWLPVRVNCPPEITLVELVPEP